MNAPIDSPAPDLRYRALFENSHTVMLIIDPADGRIVDANATAARYYGWSRERLLAMHIADINTLPRDEIQVEMAMAQSQQRSHFNFRHRRANGTIRDVEVFSGPIPIDGRPLLYSIVHDVSYKKVLDESLSFLTQRSLFLLELPKLADQLDEATFMQRSLEMAEMLTGSSISFIHFVNDDEETIELVTWSRQTLESYCHAAFDRHYPVSQAGIWADALRRRETVIFNDYASAPTRHGLPEGHAHLQRLISAPVIERGKVVMLIGIGNKPENYIERDTQTLQLIANEIWRLVERNRTQAELARFSRALERSANELFTFDAETLNFIDANLGALNNTGYTLTELRTMTPVDIKPDLSHEEFLALLAPLRERRLPLLTFTTRHQRKDSSTYSAEIMLELTQEANPVFVAVVRDISERLAAERLLQTQMADLRELNHKLEEAHHQLLQSEKMASIGQLAAGVAHEINNPIGFVHSNLGTLDAYLKDFFEILDAPGDDIPQLKQRFDYDFLKTDTLQLLSESREGLDRISKIVHDLKNFSRVGESHWEWADLQTGLESTLNIVWNELKYKCTVTKHYQPLPLVHCIPSQLNQVFMNLLINAAQAIPDKGEILISTRLIDETAVEVVIADTGKGIPPENIKRIFDPFFTTKPIGQGTGLGLSIIWGIIGKHQGTIAVDSTVDVGTRFTLTLPIEQTSADA